MEMKFDSIPKLVGKDAKERFGVLSGIISGVKWPLFLTGPSGSGKSVMAMNLAKWYAKKNNVPAYYVQLSPDQTKTSLILGLRLKNGSLVPVKGMVAQAMEEGAIVVVDEATHAQQDLLLMFNSICDRTSVTAIGDESVVAAETFRVVFCANTSFYAGNIKLPQSFAQRMIAFNFDYPSMDDEVRIAEKIVADEFKGNVIVPKSVTKYITSIFREVRSDHYPLSARNIASSILVMNCFGSMTNLNQSVSDFLGKFGNNAEGVIRGIYQRLHGKDSATQCSMKEIIEDDDTVNVLQFVSTIGRDNFKEAILSAGMIYLDFDGIQYEIKKQKEILQSLLF